MFLPSANKIAARTVHMNLRYEIGAEKHRKAIYEFMQDVFRIQEPITRSRGTTRQDTVDFFADLTDDGLKTGEFSYLVFDSGGLIIGYCLNEIVTVPESRDPGPPPVYPSNNATKIAQFCYDLSIDLYKLVPSKKMMKIGVICVHPGYMRQGVGSKLLKSSIEMARKQGCDCIATTATALKSQKLFEKHGFESLFQLNYTEYKKDDEIVFTYLHDGASCGKLMVLKLA